MAFHDSPFRRRAARAIDAVLVLLVILLIVQVWLLMASVELLLAGHRGVAIPAAVVSGLLLAAGIGLMALVLRTERSATTGLSRNGSNKTVEPRGRAPESDLSQRRS